MTICYECRRLKERCQCTKRNVRRERWYKTARWARLRMQIGRRDMWLCQDCHEAGNEIDHIRSAAQHEERFWDPDNLQVLCKSCHSKKTYAGGGIR